MLGSLYNRFRPFRSRRLLSRWCFHDPIDKAASYKDLKIRVYIYYSELMISSLFVSACIYDCYKVGVPFGDSNKLCASFIPSISNDCNRLPVSQIPIADCDFFFVRLFIATALNCSLITASFLLNLPHIPGTTDVSKSSTKLCNTVYVSVV